jgi:hypothetical protein
MLCTAAGLLATIAAGCPIITRLLAAQRHNHHQQQQQQQQQQQDQLRTTLLQLAHCHLSLWEVLAYNTSHSIISSGSSMRSILGSPHLLQTVQPAVCLAAELLLWPSPDSRPCWGALFRTSQELFGALHAELSSSFSQSETACSSSSSSSSSGAAAAAAQSNAQDAQQPWQELLYCPAVWQLLAAAQAVYAQHLRHSLRSSQRTMTAATAASTRPLQAATSPPRAGLSAGAAPAAYDMAPFAEELLVAVGVPASELQRSSGQAPCLSDEEVREGVRYSIMSGMLMWQHQCALLSQEPTLSSSGARGGQSSSDSNTPAVPQLQQLLQHWPAVLVELLLLVDDVRLKVMLLQSLVLMLLMPQLFESYEVGSFDIKSRVIGPLLQLALPHVQQIIKQLRETTSSSSSSSNSTHGASSNRGGSSSNNTHGSSSSSGTGSRSTMAAVESVTEICWRNRGSQCW